MITPSQRGTTTVSEKAVRRIAGRAAAEALPGRAVTATGVTAAVRGQRAEVSLDLALPYPASVADSVGLVQEHVAARTRQLSGLDVPRAEVSVRALRADAPLLRAGPPAGGDARPAARRWWSSRRLPVAVLTGAAALVCGTLTLDVARVRLLGLPPARWRGGAVDWLSTHGAGDLPVVLGGAGAALAGLVLVVLAVTPGQRRLLPLSPPVDQPVFALDRSAVSAVVEEAVSDVAGIGRARVRVGRRRVLVRARLSFGDREAARVGVEAAARLAVGGCALPRAPRLRVRLQTDQAWRQSPAADPAPVPQPAEKAPVAPPTQGRQT
ncbi:DUF6286 domain-containing protein [Streptomyces sp. NPDC049952]|uniref:DUF6286 domain-containing Asp23/Gls24 family envelope stress response protein n=2 Tax=Streptomyces TaxID=1883 RepID=UPI00116E95C5|nr:DUF6286 domain-containing protein [Streptomyces sp. WI03-5b]MDX2618820.1 DUF6286 domain-containing protein [Streptomyces sp. WI03-5b]TPN29294.1 Asp23/Gls24 family envelope stress response protein [Mesorhizobium sp. B2-3-3]